MTPSLAGPKRPQDRIELGNVKTQFTSLFSKSPADNGFNLPAATLHTRYAASAKELPAQASAPNSPAAAPGAPRDVVEMSGNRPTLESAGKPAASGSDITLGNGDVLIAAITSCTNTSNPSVLLAAGLLAKKAVEAGLKVKPHIKTSLAPGSRIVTEYLETAGLLPYLEKLGFNVAAYGCTTCIGNAGDLRPEFNEAIAKNDLICAAVLSGNRNFEARIHPNIKANFLASPPLVVAYAIAGTVLTDLMTEPVGKGKGGRDVYLGDIWPTSEEVHALMKYAMNGKAFKANYDKVASDPGKLWNNIKGVKGQVYDWPTSTYIAEPPFFGDLHDGAGRARRRRQGRARDGAFRRLDHDRSHLAGRLDQGKLAGRLVAEGARRDQGRLQLLRLAARQPRRDDARHLRQRAHQEPDDPGRRRRLARGRRRDALSTQAGNRHFQHRGATRCSSTDAAMKYMAEGTPTVIFGGEEYGTGSSRDWAAKGTQLLGIKAVIAKSFERIHRSNLVGMGVLPLQFKAGDSWQSLGIIGDEVFDVELADEIKPAAGSRARGHRPGRQEPPRAADLAHRHADRGGLLQARRHPAVRAAAVAGGLIRLRAAGPQPTASKPTVTRPSPHSTTGRLITLG